MSYIVLVLSVISLSLFAILIYSIYIIDDTLSEMVKDKKEKNDNITFLEKNESIKKIFIDTDNYFASLSKNDLLVRNSINVEQYKETSKNSFCTIDNKMKDKIIDTCNYIYKKLTPRKSEKIMGISIKKLINLPWTFAFVSNKNYENGYPHTRNNIIILPKETIESSDIITLSELILHEKTHVYQKLFRNDIYLFMRQNDFTQIQRRTNDPANPDIDNYRYYHPSIGHMHAYYKNSLSKSFRDIIYHKNDPANEHPFEYIAYKMQSLLHN